MFNILECDQAEQCKNSVTIRGEAHGMCYVCRLAPENANCERHFWKPVAENIRNKVLEKEKNDKKFEARKAKINKRQNRDRYKMIMSRLAAKAEQDTMNNIIKATKNSGRSNRDGDHITAGNLGLDTKLQKSRVNPIIKVEELDKANEDALRGGMILGGLVLRNKFNKGFVVLTEENFSIIISRLV